MDHLPLTRPEPSTGHPAATAPVVRMSVLWPELAEQERKYEVTVTVARQDGGEPLVPCALPEAVLSCWSATQAFGSVTVAASGPSGALAVAELLMPELVRAAGAVVTVKAAP